MYQLAECTEKIQLWASEKKLTTPNLKYKELNKMLESVKLVSKFINQDNEGEHVVEIGQIFISMIVLEMQHNKSAFGYNKKTAESDGFIEKTMLDVKFNNKDLADKFLKVIWLCAVNKFKPAHVLLSEISLSLNYDLDFCVNLAFHKIKMSLIKTKTDEL